MSSVKLSASAASSLTGDALVVGLAQDDAGPAVVASADVSRALRGLRTVWAQVGATGAQDEVVTVPAPAGITAATVVAAGLGKAARRYEPEALRRAAGAAARSLAGRSTVVLALPAKTPGDIEAVAQGALLGAYSFHRFRGVSAAKAKPGVKSFVLATDAAADRAAKGALAHAQLVADAVMMTRDWVNTPPSALYPQLFADSAAAAARAAGLDVTVLDEKALKKGGYGGIMGVGQGSVHPPRLVRVAYRHPKATKHLALVGKGITFDTGGISIKPAQGMEAMKSDMAGAAAVISTVIAAARAKAVVNVTAWAPMAENMPGGGAQRPSDVITIFGGRTVEVLNTDAEGRLILADAIVAAAAEEPDVIVDIATLTGAQTIALGVRTAGIMSNDDTLLRQVHEASQRAGEVMWPMPLPEEMRKGLESTVADIANVDWGRKGGMLSAATFLREFVPGGRRWAHLDIAGPSYNEAAPYGYTPKGGTGAGVRTMLQLAQDLADGRV